MVDMGLNRAQGQSRNQEQSRAQEQRGNQEQSREQGQSREQEQNREQMQSRNQQNAKLGRITKIRFENVSFSYPGAGKKSIPWRKKLMQTGFGAVWIRWG